MKGRLVPSAILLMGFLIGYEAGRSLPFGRLTRHDSVFFFCAFSDVGWKLTEDSFNHRRSDAKQLLQTTLEVSGAGLQSNLPEPVKNTLRMRSGISRARLAVLQSETLPSDEAGNLMSQAREDFTSLGWRDTSSEKIVQVVTKYRHGVPGNAK